MIKQIAKKLARVLAPIVINEIVTVLEEIIKKDLNNDGKVGH